MSSTMISVGEVKPGAEADLKAQLDHFTKQATKSAIPKEESEEPGALKVRRDAGTRGPSRRDGGSLPGCLALL